ncbi:EAL domain-containing protein [Escherichia coli]|nr:EAL domain-containing protein [Escherichia coli]EFK2515183.1 EAL domain-containing protein [Escherichia coli]
MNAPDKLPPETRQPVSGYLWGALAVLTCPCHLPILAAVLADMALPAELLEIELTESVAFGNPALFASFDALRAIGVRFAADDFGTGYSCLQHLKCCPITTLKIDQSFVARLPDDARDQTIVRAVIQLAHGLGMDVIFRRRLHQLIGRNGCCAASS